MKSASKIVVLFLGIALLVPMIGAVKASDAYTDVLFVVKSDSDASAVLSSSSISEYSELVSVSVITMDEFDGLECDNCSAVAIPQDGLTAGALSSLYTAGVRIYIYGDLTMDSYADYVGNNDFTASIPVFDMDGSFSGEYANRDFSSEQKNTKLYQIICNPQDLSKGLLCTFEKDNDACYIESYFNVIIEDYLASLNRSRATIVDSEYNIVHYFLNEYTSIHLSWILRRNYDEEDSDYDYFVLETRVWGNNTKGLDVTEVTAEHEKYYYSDSLLDAGPDSSTRADTVSFELSGGNASIGGAISYNYELTSEPKIVKDTSNYPDAVNWVVSMRFLGEELTDDVFKFASYWAVASYHETARFTVNYGCLMQGTYSTTQTESIVFAY